MVTQRGREEEEKGRERQRGMEGGVERQRQRGREGERERKTDRQTDEGVGGRRSVSLTESEVQCSHQPKGQKQIQSCLLPAQACVYQVIGP